MALKIVEADIRGRLARFAAAAILSAAVLAAPMVAQAQSTVQSGGQGEYPVATAIADALGRDARVGAALAEAEGARYTIDQAKAGRYPVIRSVTDLSGNPISGDNTQVLGVAVEIDHPAMRLRHSGDKPAVQPASVFALEEHGLVLQPMLSRRLVLLAVRIVELA